MDPLLSMRSSGRRWSASAWLPAVQSSRSDPSRRLRAVVLTLIGLFALSAVIQGIDVLLTQKTAPPEQPAALNASPLAGERTSLDKTDVDRMVAWNLFGDTVAPAPAIDPASAPDARLDISLAGVVMSDDPAAAGAIVLAGNQQRFFRVGEELPVTGRVTLARVLGDRVIVQNGNRFETLWLYDPRGTRPSDPEGIPPSVSPEQGGGEEQATAMQQADQAFVEVVQLSMQREDGELVGFRVQPGRDQDAFERTGLQANDLITAINGSPLTEPTQALELYHLAQNSGEIAVTLQRDGEQMDLYIRIDSL